jgi:serine/threonine protein phosphatase 1
MLKLFRKSRSAAPDGDPLPPPSVGEGMRVYAVGDIHGRLDLLRELMAQVIEDARVRGPVEQLQIILLGDLIDRGPEAAGVVDLVIRLNQAWPSFTCLMGNHEEVFQMALAGDLGALQFFTRIGGRETLLSYGIEEALVDGDDEDRLHVRMLECVPHAHRDFITGLPHSLTIGDYVFVHAGIRPGIAIDQQRPRDLHWIRQEFLRCEERHPGMVVHGHNITEEVDEQSNRIGIDTGAYASGRLTAIGLEGTDRWYIST